MAAPLSSDPHAWLRPIYAQLRTDSTFARLAPAHQFEALRRAAAEEAPAKAAQMREWNSGAQIALIGWLSMVVDQQPDQRRENELWRVGKGERELRCVAVYLASSIDLRLMEGDDFRRTQLLRDAPAVELLASMWREALVERGGQLTSALTSAHSASE